MKFIRKHGLLALFFLFFTTVAVLAGGSYWVASNYLTTDALKQRLAQMSNREVRLGTFSFSLTQGISFRNLRLSNHPNFEEGKFVKARRLVISPDWLALLWGQIKINRVRLIKPIVELHHKKDGSWNFREGFDKNGAANENVKPSGVSSQPSYDFALEHLRMVNGTVTLRDDQEDFETRVQCERAVLNDVSVQGKVNLQFQNLQWESLRGSGQATAQFNPFQFSLRESDFTVRDLSAFTDFIPPEYREKVTLSGGEADIDVNQFRFTPDEITFEGSVAGETLKISSGDYDPIPVSSIEAKSQLTYQRSAQELTATIRKLKLDEINPTGSATITVENGTSKTGLQMESELESIDVKALRQKISSLFPETVPDPMKLEGTISNLSTDVRGDWPSPKYRVSVRGKNVKVDHNFETNFPLRSSIKTIDLSLEGQLGQNERTGSARAEGVTMKNTYLNRTVKLESAKAELKPSGQVRINGQGNEFGGSIQFEGSLRNLHEPYDSESSFQLEASQLNLNSIMTTIDDQNSPLPDGIEATGTIPKLLLDLNGSISDPVYHLSTSLENGELSLPQVPLPLERLSGDFEVDNQFFSIDRLQGKYGEHPIRISGRFPYPPKLESEFILQADSQKLPIESILDIKPVQELIPSGYELQGQLDLRNVQLKGPMKKIDLNGSVKLKNGTYRSPRLLKPIRRITGTLGLKNNTVTLKSVDAYAYGSPVRGSGTISVSKNPSLDLSLTSSALQIEPVMNNVKIIPSFPEDWQPRGTVESNLKLKGKVPNLSMQGRIQSSQLTVGLVKLNNLRTPVIYDNQVLQIRDLTGKAYGGTTSTSATIDFSGKKTHLKTAGNLKQLQLRPILQTFTPIGDESSGEFVGQYEFRGPLTAYTKYSGFVDLEGNDLLLQEVDLFSDLSGLLNNSFLQLVSELAPLSTSNQGNLISSEASTNFEQVDARAHFRDGEGTLNNLNLENSQLKLDGSGQVGLDGQLDVKLNITPKSELLDRFEQDWLVNGLSQGFPVVNVGGNIMNPEFNRDSFQEHFIDNIVQYQLNRFQNQLNEESKDLLKEVFD